MQYIHFEVLEQASNDLLSLLLSDRSWKTPNVETTSSSAKTCPMFIGVFAFPAIEGFRIWRPGLWGNRG